MCRAKISSKSMPASRRLLPTQEIRKYYKYVLYCSLQLGRRGVGMPMPTDGQKVGICQ
jgi:hypothetical protein